MTTRTLSPADEFTSLHRLRVAGLLVGPTAGLDCLVERGHVVTSAAGSLLTEAGLARHEALLGRERETLDMVRLHDDFLTFSDVDRAVKARIAALQVLRSDDHAGRAGQVRQLRELADRVSAVLESTARQLPRFSGYRPRLQDALRRLEAGDRRYLADPRLDSFHTVWTEVHEDYVVTLGDLAPEDART